MAVVRMRAVVEIAVFVCLVGYVGASHEPRETTAETHRNDTGPLKENTRSQEPLETLSRSREVEEGNIGDEDAVETLEEEVEVMGEKEEEREEVVKEEEEEEKVEERKKKKHKKRGKMEEEKGGKEEGAEQKRHIVGYVPDYPSTITKPLQLSNGTHFIMFYASWCPHSTAAMPHFREALQYVVDRNVSGINMGKMEVTQSGEVSKHFKIKSTPTFIMFHRGAHYVFEDEVSSDIFTLFMHRVLEINLTQVNSSSQLSLLRRFHPVVFLLAYDSVPDADWQALYVRLAQERGLDGKFCYTTRPDIVQEFEVSKYPTLMVLKDGSSYIFSESLSSTNLRKWSSRERFPALPTVDARSFRPLTKFVLGRKLAILLVHEDPAEQRITEKRMIDTVERVAKSRKLFPSIQFVHLTSLQMAERMIQAPIVSLPYLFVYDQHTGHYYPYELMEGEQGVTESSITQFCSRVRQKKVKPHGGTSKSYLNTVRAVWLRGHAVYQTMITHRPYLTLCALFSLLAVLLFYTTLCLRRACTHTDTRPKRTTARRGWSRRRRPRPQHRTHIATGNEGSGSVRRRRRGGEEEEVEREEGMGGENREREEEEREEREEEEEGHSGSVSQSYSEEEREDSEQG